MTELPRRQRVIACIFLAFFVVGYILWGWEYLSRKLALQQHKTAAVLEPGNLLTVHLAGAVHRPGVYKIPEKTRLYELIEKAGGAHQDAAMEALNLASPLEDGQQIYLPTRDEFLFAAKDSGSFVKTSAATARQVLKKESNHIAPKKAQTLSKKIKINSASAGELESLPGVGPSLAGRIVKYRETHGPFMRKEDLIKVKGIGPKTLARFEAWVEIP